MTIIDIKYDEVILKLIWCCVHKHNEFCYSILYYYLEKGYLTEKQVESITKTYERYNH